MAARIDNGRVQLLTRTGLDWNAKYPAAVAALANLNVKTAYLDSELCGVDDAGLPSFAHMQAATDGERGVHLIYYAFDLLHLAGRDVSSGEPKRVERGGGTLRGDVLRASGSRRRRKSASTLTGIPVPARPA